MRAYQQDDSLAFNELYDRMANQIYGYLKRRVQDTALVDDIFQGTLFKFHQTRSHYRSPLPVLPWLFTICRSVMIDTLRKRERYFERIDDIPASSLRAAKESYEPPSNQANILEDLSGLKRLSDKQKQALELRFVGDLPFEEIAKRLQTSPSNVRQMISRGLRQLKLVAGKNRGKK